MRNVIELYHRGMSAEALAQADIAEYFDGKEPSFPIDPFKMIRDLEIVYQFMEFKDLEGIYILPDDEGDIPVIGINFGRPITRQRYTAAHELCHHIKDRDSSICPISGKKNSIESFADAFASELLMPTKYLRAEARKYAVVNGKVNRSDILKIAEHFGTSFESAVFSVAYKINMLDGDEAMDLLYLQSLDPRRYPSNKYTLMVATHDKVLKEIFETVNDVSRYSDLSSYFNLLCANMSEQKKNSYVQILEDAYEKHKYIGVNPQNA